MRIARRAPRGTASRATPLGATLTSVETLRRRLLADLEPVAAEALAPLDAVGAVLAEPLVVPADRPDRPIALRRGWAVAARETIGASPYAPVETAALCRVEPGAPVEPPFDAVLPFDAVVAAAGAAQVQTPASPGGDLLPRGWCAPAGAPIAAAATRLTPAAALLAAAAGLATVAVRRPRILVLRDPSAEGGDAARALFALASAGAAVVTVADLGESTAAADLVLLVGRGDLAAADPALDHFRAQGRIDGGGLALTACEAVAWGDLGGRPALLLPGRFEELLIAALVLVGPLVRRLADDRAPLATATGRSTRKIVSQIGFTELALLARTTDGAFEPLSVGRPSWTAIGRADAWIELGPECEGHAEAATTTVAAMPFGLPSAIGAKA